MSGGTTASKALRARRKAAGLSQEQLAEAARCSARTIRKLESGTARRPHRDTLHAVAGALGLDSVERDDFIGSWHTIPVDQFLAEQAREDTITQRFVELLRGIEDVSAHFVHVLDASGRQDHSIIRRSFRAVSEGVTSFPWMAGLQPGQGDPALMTTTHCVNMRLASEQTLPLAGAKAFVGDLGDELAVGEVRAVEYRVDHSAMHRVDATVAPDQSSYFAAGTAMDHLCFEVRFDPARLPRRVLAVRRSSVYDDSADAADAVETPIAVSAFGIVQHIVRPAAGNVYGLRWEWPGDDA